MHCLSWRSIASMLSSVSRGGYSASQARSSRPALAFPSTASRSSAVMILATLAGARTIGLASIAPAAAVPLGVSL
jgi:hypothetical protein